MWLEDRHEPAQMAAYHERIAEPVEAGEEDPSEKLEKIGLPEEYSSECRQYHARRDSLSWKISTVCLAVKGYLAGIALFGSVDVWQINEPGNTKGLASFGRKSFYCNEFWSGQDQS